MKNKILFCSFLFLSFIMNAQDPILRGKNGGTGIANTGKTITLGGSVITTGTATTTLAFPSTSRTYTFPDTVDILALFHRTIPRSGTLSGYPLTGQINYAPSANQTIAFGSSTKSFYTGYFSDLTNFSASDPASFTDYTPSLTQMGFWTGNIQSNIKLTGSLIKIDFTDYGGGVGRELGMTSSGTYGLYSNNRDSRFDLTDTYTRLSCVDNNNSSRGLFFKVGYTDITTTSTYSLFPGLQYESTTSRYVGINQNQYSILDRINGDARWAPITGGTYIPMAGTGTASVTGTILFGSTNNKTAFVSTTNSYVIGAANDPDIYNLATTGGFTRFSVSGLAQLEGNDGTSYGHTIINGNSLISEMIDVSNGLLTKLGLTKTTAQFNSTQTSFAGVTYDATTAGYVSTNGGNYTLFHRAYNDLRYAPINNATFTGTTTLAGDPTTALQAATKQYVDNAISGQDYKEACKYATTAALPTVVYNNGSSGVGATLTGVALGAISTDGGSPSVNDRLLVKNQASTFQNGIYTVTSTGSGIAVFVLTRTTDYNQSAEIKTGDATFVTSGSTQSATTWVTSSADSPVMGTDPITFVQTSGQGSLIAGTGINITGTTITASVVPNSALQNSSTTINGTTISLGASGTVTAAAGTLTGTALNSTVVTSSLTTAGTFSTAVWNATKIGLAYGGTNADLSATGAASNVLKQVSSGAAITVGQLAASDLSNGTTGINSVVLSTGATLTTPTLGVASATSINKVVLNTPATSSTLTVADGKVLTASNSLTFTGTDATSFAFPSTGGTVATLTATQTETNKTLTSPTLNSPTCTTPTLGVASATSINFGGSTLDTYTSNGTWSPAWTSSGTAPVLGNGTLTGKYTVVGNLVFITIFFNAGSTTTFGTGAFRFDLPFAMADTNPSWIVNFFSSTTNHYYTASTVPVTTTTFAIYGNDSGSGYGQSVPTTWVSALNGSFFTVNGVYRK